MRLVDVSAFETVNPSRSSTNVKTFQWSGRSPFQITLDPGEISTIEPYRGRAIADHPEAIVDGFFVASLTTGREFIVDSVTRSALVAARNAAA